ncbi:MAG: hypothetical protein LBC74_10645 [Planctomycetaceae bacterium]|nr:hypothetical protein [Planctomycetaceae bacterium]
MVSLVKFIKQVSDFSITTASPPNRLQFAQLKTQQQFSTKAGLVYPHFKEKQGGVENENHNISYTACTINCGTQERKKILSNR